MRVPTETVRTMFQRMLQFNLDGADRVVVALRDLLVRQFIPPGREEDLAPTLRKFGDRLLQCFDFGTAFRHL